MKEYWVRLLIHENDDYNELWITKDELYFARNTYAGGGVWYFVSDPLGYCELSHPCSEDIVFHVCDSDFKELFTSSNKPEEGFPCLRILRKREWNGFRERLSGVKEEDASVILMIHTLTGSSPSILDNWLLTFKDPELYGEKAKDYDENWCLLNETVSEKQLASFAYVGKDYCIEEIRKRHQVCNVEWLEYYSAGEYVGAKLDEASSGTMYSKRQARSKVLAALMEIYPGRNCLSQIRYDAFMECHYETKMSIAEAAKLFLGNLKKEQVNDLIQREYATPSFFTSKEEMSAKYPGYIADTSFHFTA